MRRAEHAAGLHHGPERFRPVPPPALIVDQVVDAERRAMDMPELPWRLYRHAQFVLLGQRWRPAAVISFGRPPEPDCLAALERPRLTRLGQHERSRAWVGRAWRVRAAAGCRRGRRSAPPPRARRRRAAAVPPLARPARGSSGCEEPLQRPRPAGRSRATRTQTAWPRRSAHSARTSCASIIGFSLGTRMAGRPMPAARGRSCSRRR